MRLFSYLFLIVQILYFQDVVAQKTKNDSSKLASVKWQRVEEKSKPLKRLSGNLTIMMKVILKMRYQKIKKLIKNYYK